MKDLDYFHWLCDKVSETNIKRAKALNDISYRYHFVLDKNRDSGGRILRQEYSEEYGVSLEDIQTGPASVFEVLVDMAEEFSRNADGVDPDVAYHEMISNLYLDDSSSDIETAVDLWLNGGYDKEAHGTPFPLSHYNGDARNLDMWTAMNVYINENYPLDDDWLNS